MSHSWIDLFLKTQQGHLFVYVNEDFIRENASNPVISGQFPDIQRILNLILSKDIEEITPDELQKEAEIVYGIIHQKFLLTEQGRLLMIERQKSGNFPKCPRVFCRDFTCVPYGTTNELKKDAVKMFCPNCTDVYNYECSCQIDGAYFGPDWVHYLMNEHPEVAPSEPPESYTPHVFGFNVYLPSNAPPSSTH